MLYRLNKRAGVNQELENSNPNNIERILNFTLFCFLAGEVIGAYFGFNSKGALGASQGALMGGSIAATIGAAAKIFDIYLLRSSQNYDFLDITLTKRRHL